MTTIRQIIADAYEESRLIPLGTAPEAEEEAKGLRRLRAVILSLYGNELGENLQPWSLGNFGKSAPYQIDLFGPQLQYPQINSRLIATNDSAMTVYMPAAPSDGSRMAIIDPYSRLASFNITLDGNGQTVENSATVILNTNNLTRQWLYRADQGNWVRVLDIDDNSDSPFPEEFDDLLITMLAMRLSPTFGQAMSQESIAAMNRSKSQFRARYAQTKQVGSELGLQNEYWRWGYSYGLPQWYFNKGYP